MNHEVPLESQHWPNAISSPRPSEESRMPNFVGSGSMQIMNLELVGDIVNCS